MDDPRDGLTLEAIKRDPWRAVYAALPAEPDAGLIREAHHMAQYCYEAAADRFDAPDWAGRSAFEPDQQRGETRDDFVARCDAEARAALGRIEALEKIDPSLERISPRLTNDGRPEPSPDHTPPGGDLAASEVEPVSPADFKAAGIEVARTMEGQRQLDLGDITRELADLAGIKDSPEHRAFLSAQKERGAEITAEPDLEIRAELRAEREAAGHDYAASLADRLADGLAATGQVVDAAELSSLAGVHREIADELGGRDSAAIELATVANDIGAATRDAAADGGLGLAETFNPTNAEGIRSRPGSSDYAALRAAEPELARAGEGSAMDRHMSRLEQINDALVIEDDEREPQRPEPTMTRAVMIGMGPGGSVLYEINQNRPDFGLAEQAEPQSAEDRHSSRMAQINDSLAQERAEQANTATLEAERPALHRSGR